MATDAQILAAARVVAVAHQAVTDADLAKAQAEANVNAAAARCNEVRKRAVDAQQWLLKLSAALKTPPAEVEAPKAEVKASPPEPLKVEVPRPEVTVSPAPSRPAVPSPSSAVPTLRGPRRGRNP